MTGHDDGSRISLETFRDRLAGVLESHDRIAGVIDRVAASASRRPRGELRRLGHFFAQQWPAEEVLRHREALSVCLPLVRDERSGPPSDAEIEASVHAWIYDTRHYRWQVHRRLVAFAYPSVVAALTILIVVLICVFLVPVFEQMFDEFGLSLPAPTRVLIGLSHLVREYGVGLLTAAAVLVAVLWGADRLRRRAGRSTWWSKLSRTFQSKRGVLAEWASRTASLIQAGLSGADAVAVAGAVSERKWLRQETAAAAERISQGDDPAETPLPRLHRRGCHLLAHALRLPQAAGQAALLREVAAIHYDRDQRRSGWWISIFSVLSICLLGFMIGLVVLALFMPLVSLVSGLS